MLKIKWVKTKRASKFWVFSTIVLALILLFILFSKSPDAKPIGPEEDKFYTLYKQTFIKPNGAIISNYRPVPWCSGGIGCDNDVTSEAIARASRYAYLTGDKETLDKEIGFYNLYMKDKDTFHMQWLLNPDGAVKSITSATDADLIFAEALINAGNKWGKTNSGEDYKIIAKKLLDNFKKGVYNNKIPFCMVKFGNADGTKNLISCGKVPLDNNAFRANLGYLNLPALKTICTFDPDYCNYYAVSKQLLIGAVNNNGIYTRFYFNDNKYEYSDDEGWIQSNWILKHLGTDGSQDSWNAIKTMYDQSRTHFLTDKKICQSFRINNGCDLKTESETSINVYAVYLEIATSRGDTEFRDALIKQMLNKIQKGVDYPLAGPDHFSNIFVLESFGHARTNGAYIG